MKINKILSVSLISMFLLVGQVFSQVAPSWRGQTNTTYQEWDFLTKAIPSYPEKSLNSPAGAATALISVGAMGIGWKEDLSLLGGTNKGFWDLGTNGMIQCSLPYLSGFTGTINWKAQVQLIAYYDNWTYSMDPVIQIPGATIASSDKQTLTVNALGGQWILYRYSITATMQIRAIRIISPARGSIIDRIAIDTQIGGEAPPPIPPPMVISFTGDNGRTYSLLTSLDMVKWTTNQTFVGITGKPFIFVFPSQIARAYKIITY
jgi:hypothetical protein